MLHCINTGMEYVWHFVGVAPKRLPNAVPFLDFLAFSFCKPLSLHAVYGDFFIFKVVQVY